MPTLVLAVPGYQLYQVAGLGGCRRPCSNSVTVLLLPMKQGNPDSCRRDFEEHSVRLFKSWAQMLSSMVI